MAGPIIKGKRVQDAPSSCGAVGLPTAILIHKCRRASLPGVKSDGGCRLKTTDTGLKPGRRPPYEQLPDVEVRDWQTGVHEVKCCHPWLQHFPRRSASQIRRFGFVTEERIVGLPALL